MTRMQKVTLYSKAECSLCDQMKATVWKVRDDIPFELSEVDIAGDDKLLATYGERVPLLWIDDHLAFKFSVEEEELIEKLGQTA